MGLGGGVYPQGIGCHPQGIGGFGDRGLSFEDKAESRGDGGLCFRVGSLAKAQLGRSQGPLQ